MKKKFKDRYKNQTAIAKQFGISAIKVGQLLTEAGLRDPQTRQPTQKALDENYAVSTPLKDGTPFYMWNVGMVKPILSQTLTPLSEEEKAIREVKETIRQAEELAAAGDDKMGYLLWNARYGDTSLSRKVVKAIKYKPDFDLLLERTGDVGKAIHALIKEGEPDDPTYIAEVRQMFERWFPQHLDKLKTYIVFQ